MPANRKSPNRVDVAPEQCRVEIVAIIAAGLTRLIQTGRMPAGTPTGPLPTMPPGELSESPAIGLELSGETRLSVSVG